MGDRPHSRCYSATENDRREDALLKLLNWLHQVVALPAVDLKIKRTIKVQSASEAAAPKQAFHVR